MTSHYQCYSFDVTVWPLAGGTGPSCCAMPPPVAPGSRDSAASTAYLKHSFDHSRPTTAFAHSKARSSRAAVTSCHDKLQNCQQVARLAPPIVGSLFSPQRIKAGDLYSVLRRGLVSLRQCGETRRRSHSRCPLHPGPLALLALPGRLVHHYLPVPLLDDLRDHHLPHHRQQHIVSSRQPSSSRMAMHRPGGHPC
jgi:hypothetical protein